MLWGKNFLVLSVLLALTACGLFVGPAQADLAPESEQDGLATFQTYAEIVPNIVNGDELSFKDRVTTELFLTPGGNRWTASYQWFRDGDPIPDATHAAYEFVRKDIGARIYSEVALTAPGYVDTTVRAPATDPIRRASTDALLYGWPDTLPRLKPRAKLWIDVTVLAGRVSRFRLDGIIRIETKRDGVWRLVDKRPIKNGRARYYLGARNQGTYKFRVSYRQGPDIVAKSEFSKTFAIKVR